MSKPNMEDIIKNSLESASTSSTEVSIWVTELRDFHKEETKRQAERKEQLTEQTEEHNRTVGNLKVALQNFDTECRAVAEERQALTRERTAFSKERAELQGLRSAFIQERLYLAKTIEKLEPDPLTGFWVAVFAALFALGIFAVVQLLVPLVPGFVRWVGSLV